MKAWSALTGSLLLCAAAISVAAASPTAKTESKAVTMKGEIVCMGCYMGHNAKGAEHKTCGTKCVAGGMPMGLVTADGKLYLLTMSHENADAYNKAKGMMASTVDVTGTAMEKDGLKAIEVTAVADATPAAK
jgi:late competence protein required for DNA uptake (superfamily II DNA/RNA helicase)